MDHLEIFRQNFGLFHVTVEDDRMIYKTNLPEYSASRAKELIRTLGLDLSVEIPSKVFSANTIVIVKCPDIIMLEQIKTCAI